MNAKLGIVLIALLFAWPLMGGCPVSDATDAGTDLSVDDGADASAQDASSSDTGSDASDTAAGDDSSSDGDSSDGEDSSSDDRQDQDSGDSADDSGDDADDSSDDGSAGDTTEIAFTGSFVGQWERVGQESLGGTPGAEEEWVTSETITFGTDGIPTAFVVPGYLQGEGGIDFVAEVKQVGDSVTLTDSADGLDYTLTVTVALANYGETTARVILNLVHVGDSDTDTLDQEGTGVQVIEYGLQDGQLEYSSTTTYDVAWFNGSIDTAWDVTCEGTLAPE